MNDTIATDPHRGTTDDVEYHQFLARVNQRFQANTVGGVLHVFTTDAADLWQAYLSSFDVPHERQHHNCNACRHFIERYGHLVTVEPDGRIRSAIWDLEDAPEVYKPAIVAMLRAVSRAKVTGVFLTPLPVWGQPTTGVWQHLHVTPAIAMLHKRRDKTAEQVMAEKLEDFNMLRRALADYSMATLQQAVTLLKSDALYGNEKVLGVAEWLLALRRATDGALSQQHRVAGTWLSVATAPAGFCHVRNSMIGTLLDDIEAGLPFADVARKFATKMHPLKYQRPQVAPAAGTIVQAEKLAEQLGIGPSLARRYARLEEITAIWKPAAPRSAAPAGGVFASVKARTVSPDPQQLVGPAQTITFEKFRRTVLPDATCIEVLVPNLGNFIGVTTAVNADAPPILQWDREGARNPVAWYVYNGGSMAHRWGLAGGSHLAISALMLLPPMWHDEGSVAERHGKRAIFVLPGQRDSENISSALFPSCMRSELHGVRSVIEAYSRANKLSGTEGASANGIEAIGATVRVTTALGITAYKIDRWD